MSLDGFAFMPSLAVPSRRPKTIAQGFQTCERREPTQAAASQYRTANRAASSHDDPTPAILTPTSLYTKSVNALPSRKYTHRPPKPSSPSPFSNPPSVSSFSCWPAPAPTKSKRFGPLTGDDSQICLFGRCLLITYVPCGVESWSVPDCGVLC